ncbi:MAG: Coiled-coil domain-containing protein 94 [Paramarteilia canceri]
MQCLTCNEFIYKGRKFNSRKEDIRNETYLGLTLMRFYIKCPNCFAEITFRTDLQHLDYEVEKGAKRNFDPRAALIRQNKKEEQENTETQNPMQVLEARTKQSVEEMKQLERLDELQNLKRMLDHTDQEKLLSSVGRNQNTTNSNPIQANIDLEIEQEVEKIAEMRSLDHIDNLSIFFYNSNLFNIFIKNNVLNFN